jgi:hypothetical protein
MLATIQYKIPFPPHLVSKNVNIKLYKRIILSGVSHGSLILQEERDWSCFCDEMTRSNERLEITAC